jgi:hypothetical protein
LRERAAGILAAEPGISIDDLVRRCNTTSAVLRPVLGPGLRALVAPAKNLRGGKEGWTREQMLDAIREAAARRGGSIVEQEYSRLVRQSSRRAPHAQTVIRRFGSWSAAVEAAGLTPVPTKREYVKHWKEEAIVSAVAGFIASELRSSGSAYRTWATGRDGVPSTASVQRVMSWHSAAQLALLDCVSHSGTWP